MTTALLCLGLVALLAGELLSLDFLLTRQVASRQAQLAASRQRVVVDAQCARIGSGVDPSIRLSTAGHAYVGSADDTPGLGKLPDAATRKRMTALVTAG